MNEQMNMTEYMNEQKKKQHELWMNKRTHEQTHERIIKWWNKWIKTLIN